LSRLTTLTVVALSALLALTGCSRLAAFNAAVPKDPDIRLVTRDVAYGPQARQKLDIYAPGGANAALPVIVFLYGGSWNSGARGEYGFVGSAFASRGFVTVIFDPRLVPQVRYPDFLNDSARAVRWVRDNIADYGGDPDRIALVGHSSGAYNALMLALAPEFLSRQGMRPRDLRAVVGIAGPYDFLPLRVDATRQAFAGVSDLPDTQPVTRAETARQTPPILLLHGEDDELVLPQNSLRLADKLQASGRPVSVVTYPEVGHVGILLAISRPLRERAPVVDDAIAFMSRQ
jgi:acetyl esterase/lipase